MSNETMNRESTSNLQVSVGNPAFEPGRTEVVLEPSGRIRVTSELEGTDSRREEAKIEPGSAREMIASTGETVARAREGKRYGLPDEPRYHIELGEGDSRRVVEVWRSELPEHPALDRLIRELQAALDEQTGGEFIL